MSGDPEKVALVRAFYDSGFDPDRLDEFLHPECVYHGPDGKVEGIEALREEARALHRAFSDLRLAAEGIRGGRIVERIADDEGEGLARAVAEAGKEDEPDEGEER